MSQSVKEFVRQSGVQVQKSNSNSNDEFARELEENMLRRERERAAGFRTPLDEYLVRSNFLYDFNKT